MAEPGSYGSDPVLPGSSSPAKLLMRSELKAVEGGFKVDSFNKALVQRGDLRWRDGGGGFLLLRRRGADKEEAFVVDAVVSPR